jgi:hypothetical protein
VSAQALKLLEDYAPPRPVRLLGVRVAGLGDGSKDAHEEARAVAGHEVQARDTRAQLALPV